MKDKEREDVKQRWERLRRERALDLQNRSCASVPRLPSDPQELLEEIGDHLSHAYDDRILEEHPGKIWSTLRLSTSPASGGIEFVIVLGEKQEEKRNQRRDKDLPHFSRADGAWFDFAITAFANFKDPIVLQAYSFEIRLRDGIQPRYIRFDLNRVGHDNDVRGKRCHMHPGTEDFSVPSPLMGPIEILDIFLYGLETPSKPRTDK